MESFWNIIAIVAIINVVIFIHELGHLIELLRHGIIVEEFSIGMGIKKIPKLSFRLGRLFPSLQNITFIISPILIGGFVRPNKTSYDQRWLHLTYKQKSLILGGGIWTNIMTSLIILTATFLNKAIANNAPSLILAAGIWGTLTIVVFVLKSFICRYLVPLAGMVMIILLVIAIINDIGNSIGGPVTVVKVLNESLGKGWDVLSLISFLSFNIGLVNALPFAGLDGGKIIREWLPQKNQILLGTYDVVGTLLLAILIVIALINDSLSLFR